MESQTHVPIHSGDSGKKGPMTDIDLLKELRSNLGEVSFRELNRELMKLELAGILRVSRLTKGKRQVELMRNQ